MRRCAVAIASLAILIASLALVETGPLPGRRVAEGTMVLAALMGLAWASRGKLRDGLLVACSLVFGLTAIEVAMPLFTSPARRADDGLVGPRPVLGWGATRAGRFHLVRTAGDGRTIYDVHATIDANLDRRTIPSDGARPIAFFGDSFIFGDGLDDKDTLPQAFADLNGGKIPVLNLGFSGWAPSQNLAALQTGAFRPALDAPRHLILFTATFQIERTACKREFARGSGPRYVLDRGAVTLAGTCNDAGQIPTFVRRLGIGDSILPDALTRRDVELYIAIIETFVATARRDMRVETTVLFDPAPDGFLAATGYTQDAIIKALRAAGVDVLVRTFPKDQDTDQYVIPGDGHPTALANRVTARQIEEHLRRVDPQAVVPPEDFVEKL